MPGTVLGTGSRKIRTGLCDQRTQSLLGIKKQVITRKREDAVRLGRVASDWKGK